MGRTAKPSDAELVARVKAGDREAADLIVRRHTALVVSIADRTGYTHTDLDDLIQEGCLAILKAARGWDATANSKFTTYAYTVIRNTILNAVAVMKKGEWARPATDRAGFDLSSIVDTRSEPADVSAVLAGMTALERGLVTLIYGLNGTPISVAAAAKRYGLTCPQAKEILISAFLRIRRSIDEGDQS